VSDPYTQGRLQDIEKHVRSLDETVKVLASVDRAAIRKRIELAFADPRVIIVFRGVQEGLTQPQIAAHLKARDLSNPTQSFVSGALAKLHDLGFVDKAPKGAGYVAVEGWQAFNLKRMLRKGLKAADVDDLA
jgi:hypothetical protein